MKSTLLALALSSLGLAQDAPSPQLQKLAELHRAGKWEEVADAFETLAPKERGQYLGAWFQALEKAKRWNRLQEVAERVEGQFAGKPGHVDILQWNLKALLKLGRRGEAARCCERLGDLGQSYFYIQAIDLARETSDWEAMDGFATKLLATRATDPIGLAVKGEALARMERFAAAEPFLQAAAPANPKDPWVLVNLACCLNERKAWAEAIAACDRALALDPKVVPARINRGRACFELGRYGDSKADYEAALAEMPGNAMLEENLRQATRYLEAQQRASKGKS